MVAKQIPNPVSLKDSLKNSHGPGMAVQTYAQMIRSCVDMKVDALEKIEEFNKELGEAGKKAAEEGLAALKKINTHLATARNHVDTWNRDILPHMFVTNADIHGYGAEFLRMGGKAHDELESARKGTEAEMKAAMQVAKGKLKALGGAVHKRAVAASDLATSLATFQSALQDDARAFANDKTSVDAVLTGDTSWVKSISDEVDSLNAGIKKDTAMIAGGAVAIAAGVIIGVVGGFLVATGVGTGVGLLVIGAGVVVAAGGVALTTIGGLDLKKKQEQLAADQKKLTLLKGSVAAFRTAEAAVGSLAKAAAEAADGAGKLHRAWLDLKANLDEVESIIGDAIDTGGDTLKVALENTAEFLSSALDEWKKVQQASQTISQALTGLKAVDKHIDQLQLAA
ncbi:HBL/NHE enterotoxin family protein [Streptomyces flavidovirens]|uniref:HBL/NHE enterotoxin family protein n=2 Tax=Streptomyces flavidovirens TaxID=67298 RepID=A0ABW6RIQ2_9ACTN